MYLRDGRRRSILLPAVLILFAGSLYGQEAVLNDGFELQDWIYWDLTGNLPEWERGVMPFDTVNPGVYTMAYGQHVWDGTTGGIAQTLYLLEGVPYTVEVHFAYASC